MSFASTNDHAEMRKNEFATSCFHVRIYFGLLLFFRFCICSIEICWLDEQKWLTIPRWPSQSRKMTEFLVFRSNLNGFLASYLLFKLTHTGFELQYFVCFNKYFATDNTHKSGQQQKQNISRGRKKKREKKKKKID